MPILYPSTVAYAKLCFNIVARVVVFTLAACAMMICSIPLKWVVDYLARVYGVPENIQDIMSQLAIGYPIVFSLAILFIGFVDVWRLVAASFAIPSSVEEDSL